jgi:WD40 repeat protein
MSVSPPAADISRPHEQLPKSPYFSSAMFFEDDKVGVMSDVSVESTGAVPANSTPTIKNDKQAPSNSTLTMPATQQSGRSKYTSQFSEEEEHLLIFLKEVKKFQWKVITTEFQKHYPGRLYHTLQSRYTTKTNRRDRSRDPAILRLPPQWVGEASIDWTSVHADNPGPRDRVEVANLHRSAPRPTVVHELTEHDNSSGTDSDARQARPRRAPPVDYDVRKCIRQQGLEADAFETGEVFQGGSAELDTPMRSQSPVDELGVPLKAHVVINSPLNVDFDASDASVALIADHWSRHLSAQKLPYLDTSQRISLQNPPEDWEWDQLASRDWQGMLLHVDFSPAELAHVERVVAKLCNSPQTRRHNTQRRQLRTMLKSLTDSKLQHLVHSLKHSLPARNSNGIRSFLDDAREGQVAETPQILRLSAAQPQNSASTMRVEATSSMLRQRELGLRLRRGWQAASRPLTYPVKNKVMDTLGPSAAWTGASSDIHTVAWSQDGERFAAGAVAVTDADSMQYNRPNNFLFGSLPDATIHELAEHTTERQRTQSGANSSHAMFVSQDPKLYMTVTAVAFAKSGKLMYSAGYDQSVCVWDLEPASAQPSLASKFRHKAEVEMMVVDHKHAGVLATAAKRTSGAAVKLITLDEDNPSEFSKHNFHSAKAASRSDLRILPQALQFEPRHGNHLLAGFGANVREDNAFDTNGDLCLWDIASQAQIPVHGSGRNVFDIAFNPNRRYMPLFAAGCVAGGNVNRGTRSVIRLYDERLPDKYTCPLEIECRALDMNDVVWSPQNEELIAAGCTDGRVYVWDMRNSDNPLRVISHGRSLMPLQDGVPPERTDTGVRFLSWGENATRLYSGSSDGVVKVWDVTRSEKETFVKDIITVDSGIMAGAFSPDYSKLVVGEVNGSVNVLDVGRDDCTLKDTRRLQYVPYACIEYDDDSVTGETSHSALTSESGVAEGNYLLRSQQLQLAPMGNLPIMQVVQGPSYAGPFDQGVDALHLREQALEFQLSLVPQPGPQCDISTCRDNIVKVTSEEIGDSGRSADRIPDELRRQWTAVDATTRIMPGKSKCTRCGRPAQPSLSNNDAGEAVLCERCSFRCFRCHAVNAIAPATTTLMCEFCRGWWEIGALGYECVGQPLMRGVEPNVPLLRRYGRDLLEEVLDENDTTYADDEMNALTDYYFSLAIDPPESLSL